MKYVIFSMTLIATTTAYSAAPPIDSEDYAIMKPYEAWIRGQYTADHKQWCCSIADGRPVEARMVDGHWQVFVTPEKFEGSTRGWLDVPDSAVLRGENPVGVPIAWVIRDKLYCFAPGNQI
jgi:hypothetical protein